MSGPKSKLWSAFECCNGGLKDLCDTHFIFECWGSGVKNFYHYFAFFILLLLTPCCFNIFSSQVSTKHNSIIERICMIEIFQKKKLQLYEYTVNINYCWDDFFQPVFEAIIYIMIKYTITKNWIIEPNPNHI